MRASLFIFLLTLSLRRKVCMQRTKQIPSLPLYSVKPAEGRCSSWGRPQARQLMDCCPVWEAVWWCQGKDAVVFTVCGMNSQEGFLEE